MNNKALSGLLICIAGPSGVGKGLLIQMLKKNFPQFVYPISHTTRAIRPGEKEGEVYHFTTLEEFKNGIEQGDFLEWAIVHQKDYYGTSKASIINALEEGKIVVREVDMQGIKSIKAVLDKKNLLNIFIKPESIEVLRTRILRRGKLAEEEIARRLHSAQEEIEQASECDYSVFSRENQADACYEEVKNLIFEHAQKAGLNI